MVCATVSEQIGLHAENLTSGTAETSCAIPCLDPDVRLRKAFGPVLLLMHDSCTVLVYRGEFLGGDGEAEIAVRAERVDVPVQREWQVYQQAFWSVFAWCPRRAILGPSVKGEIFVLQFVFGGGIRPALNVADARN